MYIIQFICLQCCPFFDLDPALGCRRAMFKKKKLQKAVGVGVVAVSNNFEFVNHDNKRKVSPLLSFITFLNFSGEKVFSVLHTITPNYS